MDAQTRRDGSRGAFIVLEGLDRSGKTTQVELLEQRLAAEGRPVETMRFPGEFSSITSCHDVAGEVLSLSENVG